MFVYQGKEIMKQVRELFAAGHKSNNKQYYVDLDGIEEPDLANRFNNIQLKKISKRKLNSAESDNYRTPYVPCRYDDALAILKIPRDHRSGNCDEMSSMSAFYAHRDYMVAKDRLYIADIGAPADHVFCVVTDAGGAGGDVQFDTVTAFTRSAAAMDWVIIDPWLHVCCRGRDYLIKGNEQLGKWGRGGKRVSWAHGSQGSGWYPPHGEYKDEFAKGPVTLVGFFSAR